MSNKNYTAVLFVLDSSGSMDDDYEPMQEAFHMMLEEQARKMAGFITVDVHYFEETVSWGEEDGDPLTIDLSMYANGGTQIYNTTGAIVDRFEKRLKALPENNKPGHVVVIVMTDGDSNRATNDYGYNVKTQIERLTTQDKWDFAFVARTGVDVNTVASGLGIPKQNTVQERFTAQGIRSIADKLGAFISASRSGADAHF